MKKMILIVWMILMMSLLVSCAGKKDAMNETDVTDDIDVIDEIENKDDYYDHITLSITEIGDDYFTAGHPWPSPMQYKVYTTLKKDYCVGDFVELYFDVMVEINENYYEISDDILISHSDFKLEEGVAYKPIIYLYPVEETEIFVALDYNGTLTHTYPEYNNGWEVTAYPDGMIVDSTGVEYPYLFWEGESNIEYDMSKGFCIKGDKTENFLRDKLACMGLKKKELEEFIEFWVPFMEKNTYNKICFQTTAYTEHAKLIVNPIPDRILRIYMVFQPLDEFIEIEEQTFDRFERTGFTVVEWGGSIIK